MDVKTLKECFAATFDRMQAEVEYLSSLDAATGDGDHGVTIGKIAAVVSEVMRDEEECTLSETFENLSDEIMSVNGGAAVPLWSMMAGGIGEAVEDVESEITAENVANMFEGALEGLGGISTAKPGEKTLLDVLLPAKEAAAEYDGDDIIGMMRCAADAAVQGAENTKNMIAKFGRAKNLREKSIGYYDPGAVSMSLIIKYLYEEAVKAGV